jgi:hypothetical protein
MGNEDREARIEELYKVDGPLTVDEARELRELERDHRAAQRWGES